MKETLVDATALPVPPLPTRISYAYTPMIAWYKHNTRSRCIRSNVYLTRRRAFSAFATSTTTGITIALAALFVGRCRCGPLDHDLLGRGEHRGEHSPHSVRYHPDQGVVALQEVHIAELRDHGEDLRASTHAVQPLDQQPQIFYRGPITIVVTM